MDTFAVWPWRYSCNLVAKKEVDLDPFRARVTDSRIGRASRFSGLDPAEPHELELRGKKDSARKREHPYAPAEMAIAGGMALSALFRMDEATAI